MIAFFTDFGLAGPYTGQMQAAVWAQAPGLPIVSLFADAPAFRPKESAYLLAAHAATMPAQMTFLCVVDPGVGSERAGVALRLDGRWFVGPENGLLEIAARRARHVERYVLPPPAAGASASFHGRDVFAPVAARLARGDSPAEIGLIAVTDDHAAGQAEWSEWPDDLAAVIYADAYGNLMTGLRAEILDQNIELTLDGRTVHRARTFSDVPPGTAFWYRNSNGLAEIAVNCGRADRVFPVTVGTVIELTACL